MKRFGSRLAGKDRVCPWWLAYSFDNPLRRFLHDPRTLLGPFVREGMTAVDIGCGLGYFTLSLAKMVGERGSVIAVDVQQEMLDRMTRRALKAGLASRIRPLLVREDDIGVSEPVDFVLAFWMVHESPDIPKLLSQIFSIVKDTGTVLIAEPLVHVSRRRFEETLDYAREAGFRIGEAPSIRMSRAVVLSKEA